MSKTVLRLSAIGIGVLILGALPVQGQRGGGGAAVNLPDGSGKELVTTVCASCHALTMITSGWGYDRKGWDDLISSMVKLPDEQRDVITSYLGTHFNEMKRPPTVVVPGNMSVTIKEWIAPSLGSRPHDPLAAADGSIWWTGMFANVLGHLDPQTGVMKEFPLKSPNTGPHGLTEDKAGNIWFTGNLSGLVGKLDPKTGEVTEYRMPNPAARDPHTPLFDPKGNLWFTLQNSNMLGKLNPQTGDIKLITMPTPRSQPYGMVMNSKGVLFIVLFGTNKVAAVDPDSMAVKEYNLPNADSRPRRIAITSDDTIWYSDYGRGYLGRLNPNTGEVKEWPSPSGRQSQPYAITALKDIIWYCESAVRPNTLVRFDPKTEKFQSWIIPSGGGVVRNMMPTKDGSLVMAESGVNRVALAKLN